MRRSLVLCVLLVFVIFGAGCGRGSFVGKRLDNFSAYYNTYYNAERALDEGLKTFDTGQEEQPIDQNVYLPLFGSVDRITTQRKPFEDAILKCADILRKHPDSKWVDDAVMVIGKAWFFTQNYVGAEEKFNEVLTLESRLHDEARFWLARTLIASVQYDLAFDHLQESLNREDISRRWEPKLRLALAELHVQRKNWDEAIVELETGLEGVRDKELAARAYFLRGQVYETLERYDEAVAAYDRVGAYNPFYELSYAAQYSAVRVEGEHGDPDQAMRRLRRMERDDKNYDHRAELAFLRGRVLQASGEYDESLDVFYELLYDPTANGAAVRGPVHYALGTFYRDVYEDFPYAAAYFDTAQTSLTRPGAGRSIGAAGAAATQPAYAPAAITDGEEQARIFLGYADVMARIAEMDSLLYLGSLDDSTYNEVVLELRLQRAEELEAQRREMERLQAERQFQQAGSGDFNTGFGRTPAGKDVSTGKEDRDAGFLYHRNAIRVQEARADFVLQWGDRPLVPNWRRLDAVNNIGVDPSLSDSLLAEDEYEPGEELPEIDLSNVPRDSLSQLQMKADRAVARYELANVLFLSMNRPDSAAAWYRMVIEEDSDEPVAQRAYYALAEVQRALADTLAAQRLYRTIVDRYPNSDFTDQAYERLGIEPPEDIISDTLTLAEAAYDEAYAAWKRQDYEPSLNDMVALAIDYPETEAAPRALFAAGSVYMEWAARDSLDLFAVLPLAIPDSVLHESEVFKPVEIPAEEVPGAPGADPGAPGLDKVIDPPEGKDLPEEEEEEKEEGNLIERANRMMQRDTPVKQIDVPGEEADSLAVATDSLALGDETLADSTVALADSTALPEPEPEPEPVRLETLYTSLVARYPEAPQVPQANRILEALQERRDALQAIADSLAADSLAALAALAPVDSLTADSLAADSLIADSLAVDSLAADSLAQIAAAEGAPRKQLGPDDQQAQEETPADSSAVARQQDRRLALLEERRANAQQSRPPAPADPRAAARDPQQPGIGMIDWSPGGWTILVRTETEVQKANEFARNFGRYVSNAANGPPVDVFVALVREKYEYRVGVGLFKSELEATEAFSRIKDLLPNDARVVEVPEML